MQCSEVVEKWELLIFFHEANKKALKMRAIYSNKGTSYYFFLTPVFPALGINARGELSGKSCGDVAATNVSI